MKNSRSRARELALQGLYQWLLSGTDPAVIRAQLAEDTAFAHCDAKYFDRMWLGLTSEFEVLLAAVAQHCDRAATQLSPIEKSVLVIGAWELLREPDVPYRVAIDEAVELAKSYGGTDAHKFVNGVLDKLATAARPPEVSAVRV